MASTLSDRRVAVDASDDTRVRRPATLDGPARRRIASAAMWELWPDPARVMTRPARAYTELLSRPAPALRAALAHGPLLTAFAIGAGLAFLDGGHLGPARLLP